MTEDIFRDGGSAIDVELTGHYGIQLAGFQRAITDTVQHQAEAIGGEQFVKTGMVLNVKRE
jgi:hypothetical protein